MSTEEIGLWAGFVLTLMVYSYLIRDNFLYRLAVYVFVGMAAGYVSIVTFESVLTPWLESTVGSGEVGAAVLGFIPFILVLLLLFKSSSRIARFGNLGIAFIIGVGAAVAVVGALLGTLVPFARLTAGEASGTEEATDILNALVILVGVVTSLLYFQYLSRRTPQGEIGRGRTMSALTTLGQGFIVITLGAIYAAAILTSLTIFSERIAFILNQLTTQIGG